MKGFGALAIGAAMSLLAGCQLGYYTQLIRGQYELLSRREPIERLLARPDTEPNLRHRLSRALDARRFAIRELHLPDNGSYTSYADLDRPFAVWNVFAAPEFAFRPHEWCFPFAGCLAYRGYYSLENARKEAEAMRAKGYDVFVGGVPAYSTLGWFADPVLSTIAGTEDLLVATIFHELAHQKQFVEGDTAFNESFATFVEEQGLQRFLKEAPDLAQAARARKNRQTRFVEVMMAGRRRLEALYASAMPVDAMRARKIEEMERLRRELEALDAPAAGGTANPGSIGELNNARLMTFGLYHEWVPAFAELFRQAGGDWPRFYLAVDAIADVDAAARKRQLEKLRAAAQAKADAESA